MVEGAGAFRKRGLQHRTDRRLDARQVAQCRIENGAHQRPIRLAQLAIGRIAMLMIEHAIERRLAVDDRTENFGRGLTRAQTGLFGAALLLRRPLRPCRLLVRAVLFRT
ncbi:hypothetical protein D3C87_1709400 [compost metagenome]